MIVSDCRKMLLMMMSLRGLCKFEGNEGCSCFSYLGSISPQGGCGLIIQVLDTLVVHGILPLAESFCSPEKRRTSTALTLPNKVKSAHSFKFIMALDLLASLIPPSISSCSRRMNGSPSVKAGEEEATLVINQLQRRDARYQFPSMPRPPRLTTPPATCVVHKVGLRL